MPHLSGDLAQGYTLLGKKLFFFQSLLHAGQWPPDHREEHDPLALQGNLPPSVQAILGDLPLRCCLDLCHQLEEEVAETSLTAHAPGLSL